MKIAFLGTKGIPNNYGGFEQFAEYLSVKLATRGHEVTVYNPSFHPYDSAEFKGVRIQRIFSPEKWVGSAGNFIYDHLCLAHALRQNYDVIYEAGYHSVAVSYKLLGIRKYRRPVILTNMDGLEWMRSKWSYSVRKFIRWLEKIAVKESPFLISDNPGIRQYYLDQFSRDSFFLPYGADPVDDFDPHYLVKYDVALNDYFILIARMEPENNVAMILESYVKANARAPFLVVGNFENGFGRKMFKKYAARVRFLGSIYNKRELDSLRHFSKAYFHGHSVGGTNPSLLEAMSSKTFIISHSNPFNRGVLGKDAIYFENEKELIQHFGRMDEFCLQIAESFKLINFQKIVDFYNWDKITLQHEALFETLQKTS